MPAHIIAIAIGMVLDRLIGDPPNWPHPVKWLGTTIGNLTKLLNKGRMRTVKGGVLWLLICIGTFVLVIWFISIAYRLNIFAGIAAEALLIAAGLAQKSLRDAALLVYEPLQSGDIKEAREKLSWIVGRDTEKLDESAISRAAIETISENTSDGITAPLFWAFLLGAPGLWLYKAVNTLDSMIGYKDDRYREFGKISARMDDLFNWIPSRITGVLIILCTPNEGGRPVKQRISGWLRDAKRHMSPNSGYLEAATAWQLNIQLGGSSTYRGILSERAVLGPPVVANMRHIRSTIHQMQVVSWIFWLLCTVIGVVFYAIT
ncbi:cobalamin biosynthesis protein CobD [Sporosarcina sp. P37]|uniref:adenosylcobinamide-phosphate synthase CbiB n=1 Tax=unclassified Sporosarcina TaxID=2647733 RepID=UPI000A17ACF5|nr:MULTISPECIES: adenosylcobinamide-phosphate synthase CbiB [unclassified Sporosarcina]ARK26292.1 cobalamin biosynthesis protein CobD [Sporosarcina sp. P37]PID17886.1 cobalamin biosynthesis protein CobD [Sporosarcina sp. P35]